MTHIPPGIGIVTLVPDYGVDIVPDRSEVQILLDHGVGLTHMVNGNTMLRSQETAAAAIALLIFRVNRAYDEGLLTNKLTRPLITGFVTAVEGNYLGDYCFDKLLKLEELLNALRNYRSRPTPPSNQSILVKFPLDPSSKAVIL